MGSGGCEDVGAPTAMALGCYDGVPATTPNMENNCSNSSVYDHHYNSMSSSMATSSSIPIDSSNIGFRLLKKHGWKEGTGLGIAGQGRLEPIEAHVNKNKLGLGAEKGKKASAPENSKKYRKEDKLPVKKKVTKKMKKQMELEKRLQEQELVKQFYREFWPDNV